MGRKLLRIFIGLLFLRIYVNGCEEEEVMGTSNVLPQELFIIITYIQTMRNSHKSELLNNKMPKYHLGDHEKPSKVVCVHVCE
jgi:hypothetical protein